MTQRALRNDTPSFDVIALYAATGLGALRALLATALTRASGHPLSHAVANTAGDGPIAEKITEHHAKTG